MDIANELAEVLANAFLYFGHPLRHRQFVFKRGSELLIVTVERQKEVKEYAEAMEELGWVTTST